MIYTNFPKTKDKRALVLVSGGMDSRVCLQKAVSDLGPENVVAACTYYGQKHDKEIEYARKATQKLGVEFHLIDLSSVFSFNKNSSALLKGSEKEIELTSYEEQMRSRHDEGKPMVPNALVPFRNGLLLSYATTVALQMNCDYVIYGAHASDAHIELESEDGQKYEATPYPDCTEAFISAMSVAIHEGTGGLVSLVAPIYNLTKTEVALFGSQLGMSKDDFKATWSCYCGGQKECGVCGTCLEKIDALKAIGFTENDLKEIFYI